MLIDPMYYATFFDVERPLEKAITTRIERNKFVNLTDDIVQKEVVLMLPNGTFQDFKVLEVKTFSIINSVDNTHIAVCNVERKGNSITVKPGKK